VALEAAVELVVGKVEKSVERIGEVFGTEQSSARPVQEEQMLKRLSTRPGVEGTSPSQYGRSPGLRPEYANLN